MGRPTKCNPDVQERICRAIRAGNFQDTAALYGGVDISTYYRWLEKGEQGRSPYREFREAVKKARADVEIGTVAIIQRAMAENWQAAAWWLERSFPDRWGRLRQPVEHTGKHGGPVEVTDARAELAAIVARVRPGN